MSNSQVQEEFSFTHTLSPEPIIPPEFESKELELEDDLLIESCLKQRYIRVSRLEKKRKLKIKYVPLIVTLLLGLNLSSCLNERKILSKLDNHDYILSMISQKVQSTFNSLGTLSGWLTAELNKMNQRPGFQSKVVSLSKTLKKRKTINKTKTKSQIIAKKKTVQQNSETTIKRFPSIQQQNQENFQKIEEIQEQGLSKMNEVFETPTKVKEVNSNDYEFTKARALYKNRKALE